MNLIKLLHSFFGLGDKKQAEKTIEVSQYLEDKQFLKNKDLHKIKAKAVKVSQAALDLKDAVDDIVKRMAIVTSGRRYNG